VSGFSRTVTVRLKADTTDVKTVHLEGGHYARRTSRRST